MAVTLISTLAMSWWLGQAPVAGCTTDSECKGERTCVEGVCRSPAGRPARDRDLAQSTRKFGDKGVISPLGSISLGYTSYNGGSTTNFTFAPGLLYFVIDNLAVGGQIQLNFQSGGGPRTVGFGLGPMVGYNIPLDSRFSIFPSGGLSLNVNNNSLSGPGPSTSATNTSLYFDANVPFLYHVGNYYLGVGPNLFVSLYSSAATGGPLGTASRSASRNVAVGVSTVLGGWLPGWPWNRGPR